ncbi:hypothetical protein INT45_004117 [Circinella minor]|uniref:Uncharacterized protein n=1 Tax=Circinella minor TaxID=1195481 RepID=A0A8H7RX96_9FUNG|nr:hypothetical protein INT45_004117 [Circinella minor]
MPKTPPLLIPTTSINYFESHQQKEQSSDGINSSANGEENQNDDQHVLDDDRVWQMLEDQHEVDDHVIISSNNHDDDMSLVLNIQQDKNETAITDGNHQYQQSLNFSVHRNDNHETLLEQEGDDHNDVEHDQEQSERQFSSSPLLSDNNNDNESNNNDIQKMSSQLDITTTNMKVNELVQTLVDLMQQTTEDVSQAESVTRSMIEGLKEYRETITTRGDQLEQTWQDIRLYASNIAGHHHYLHQSPPLYNDNISFPEQQLDSNNVTLINEDDNNVNNDTVIN